MGTFSWLDYAIFAAYLLASVLIGLRFVKGQESLNDYFLAGQNMNRFVVAMTVGRVVGGPVVDRIGRVAAIRITAGMGAVGLVLFILGGPMWLVVIGTVLWGFGVSLGFPLGMSAAADGAANPAARVSAVAIIGYLAFLAGPPLIGFLGQHFGILNALFLVLALLVAAFLAAPAVRPEAAPARESAPDPA